MKHYDHYDLKVKAGFTDMTERLRKKIDGTVLDSDWLRRVRCNYRLITPVFLMCLCVAAVLYIMLAISAK